MLNEHQSAALSVSKQDLTSHSRRMQYMYELLYRREQVQGEVPTFCLYGAQNIETSRGFGTLSVRKC